LADRARTALLLLVAAFASSIAHEVNPPVVVIVANGEGALRRLANRPPNLQEARAALNRIIRDAERANSVVGRTRGMPTADLAERRWEDLGPPLHVHHQAGRRRARLADLSGHP
jgi:signal transduction histidine kinase